MTDAYGNPLGGQTVVFKPNSGTVTPTRGLTDADGRTRVRWTPRPEGEEAGARRERQRERCEQDAGAQRSAVTLSQEFTTKDTKDANRTKPRQSTHSRPRDVVSYLPVPKLGSANPLP